MTVAAMGWAFKQDIPSIPKFVLVTLGDQADDETGRVCYGKTGIKHIARKAGMSPRALYRYIGALVLNGYIICESGAEKGQPNQYWLRLDREKQPDEKWRWTVADHPNNDDGDAAEGCADSAPPPGDDGGDQEKEGVQHAAQGGVQLAADQESTEDQSTKASAELKKSGFSKKDQDLDRANLAKEREAAKPAQYFVYEHSDAWKYWVPEMRRRTGHQGWYLTCDRVENGRTRRGWYFPSLFPPAHKPTAPPNELSDEDAQALTAT